MGDAQYYVQWRGKSSGPLSQADVLSQTRAGQITRFHMISSDQKDWKPAGELEWIFAPKPVYVHEPEQVAAPVLEDAPQQASPSQGESQWLYRSADGTARGPVSFETLRELAAAGQLDPHAQISKEGENDWVQARQVSGLVFSGPKGKKGLEGPRPLANVNMEFCSACGGEMARTAAACPHCGHNIGKRTWRSRSAPQGGSGDTIHYIALGFSGLVIVGVFLPYIDLGGLVHLSLMQLCSVRDTWPVSWIVIGFSGFAAVSALLRLTHNAKSVGFSYMVSALCAAGALLTPIVRGFQYVAETSNRDFNFLAIAGSGFYLLCFGVCALFIVGIIAAGQRD